MRISAIIPLKAGGVALLLAASAANGQSAPPVTKGLRDTIINVDSGTIAPAVLAKEAEQAANADAAATPKEAETPAKTAEPDVDAVLTGAVPNEPPATSRVLPEPVIDTSNPPDFIAGNALRRTLDEDPYAPLGIRAGSFVIFPEVGFGAGYTSNSTDAPGGTGAALGAIAPQVLIQSDWSRHEATLFLRGSQEAYSDGADNVPEAEATGTVRLDLSDRWAADFRSS